MKHSDLKKSSTRNRKTFLGGKLRRFREDLALTQAAMATSLEISPSYLNQIENDQRPLTVQVLLKLSTTYNIDLQAFSEGADERLASEVLNCLDDPLFHISKGARSKSGGESVDIRDLREAVSSSPTFAKHFLTLYRAYSQTKHNYADLAQEIAGDEAVRAVEGPQFPYEEVRDFFYYKNNYFDDLDKAAESLFNNEGLSLGEGEAQLVQYLERRHNIRVDLVGENDGLRTFNTSRKILTLSKLLSHKQRVFQLAHQICLLEQGGLLDSIIAEGNLSNPQSAAVCRVGLANYYAGALLMPYEQFLERAQAEKYDIERLQIHFNVSFEQVCHRVSTLQRPHNKGIPFYFVRVDMAGNISKRQSASGFHFAQVGGACPLWNVHEAFATPGKILRQVAEMPDGKRYFCLARTVTRTEGGYLMPQKTFAVGLGCEIHHAPNLVYSVGFDLEDKNAAIPIGVSCRVCERTNCPQRAFPPIGKAIRINEHERDFLPYQFIPETDK